jgi:lipoate-protein ligase A
MPELPRFTGEPRKNDDLFVRGAGRALPDVYAYCQQTVEVVHGPSCKIVKEIEVERCEADGVAIAARRGGGGTVVLSPGMVIAVVVGARHKAQSVYHTFSRIHRAMIGLFEERCGISLEEKGISDLAVDDMKALGSSLYLCNRPCLYFYQSSLMVESDVSLLAKYLRHPPREPRYREGRSHERFCTTLRRNGCTLAAEQIAHVLNSELRGRITAPTRQ